MDYQYLLVISAWILLPDPECRNFDDCREKFFVAAMSRYFITHAVLNNEENADPAEVARSAYDSENYAKCIRTIEKLMSRDGTLLERWASIHISLALRKHSAYFAITKTESIWIIRW